MTALTLLTTTTAETSAAMADMMPVGGDLTAHALGLVLALSAFAAGAVVAVGPGRRPAAAARGRRTAR
jgi:hypothetical protein